MILSWVVCCAAATEPDAPIPVCNPKSTGDSLLCTWQLLRSNGAKITSFRLQRKRLRGRPHPDASDSSDSDDGEPLEIQLPPINAPGQHMTVVDGDAASIPSRRSAVSQKISDALALEDVDVKVAPRWDAVAVNKPSKEHWVVSVTDLPVIGQGRPDVVFGREWMDMFGLCFVWQVRFTRSGARSTR
jgi:hypothetical protein